jgi:hypothetical protein
LHLASDVGDKIPLSLAEDLKAGDVVLVKKGTTAFAVVTGVDMPGIGGLPGEVVFQVDSLRAGGAVIKLHGTGAREGQDREIKAAFIPAGGLFVHWLEC